ncbi:MAG: NAD(P)-binding protein [Acidimicrobiales bacterium]
MVVGAGPNGLAAAITLARAGRSVRVYEAAATPGGGARSAELTLPGYVHDVCSAIHPLASATSFMASLDLEGHQRAGASLSFAAPEVDFAHPIGGDRAGAAYRSLDATIERLGTDGKRWEQLVGWVAERWDRLADDLFTPITELPKHPLSMAGFGARAALPATISARIFDTRGQRALRRRRRPLVPSAPPTPHHHLRPPARRCGARRRLAVDQGRLAGADPSHGRHPRIARGRRGVRPPRPLARRSARVRRRALRPHPASGACDRRRRAVRP